MKEEVIVNMSNYKIGDMVKIKSYVDHDHGYEGQTGIIYKIPNINQDGCEYYNVVAWDKDENRFWGCGFWDNEFNYLGHNIEDFIYFYSYWLSDDCWKNTNHKHFNHFMKALKKIRKKHIKNVESRMRILI